MKRLRVGTKVRVSRNADIEAGRTGILIAVTCQGKGKDYIVQFSKPAEWTFFPRRDLRLVKKGRR